MGDDRSPAHGLRKALTRVRVAIEARSRTLSNPSSWRTEMQNDEVRAHLQALALTPTEAARLLGVGLRTMRRWTQLERPEDLAHDRGDTDPDGKFEDDPADGDDDEAPHGGSLCQVAQGAAQAPGGAGGARALPTRYLSGTDGISGPAAQALRAWLKLHRLGLHWHPAGVPIGHVEPATAVTRARLRGAPASAWRIDVERGCAFFQRHRISFTWRSAQCFALQTHVPPVPALATFNVSAPSSTQIRAALIDDACACIARRLAGEREAPRVPLVLGDPMLGYAAPAGPVTGSQERAIDLLDVSWSPTVVCRIPLSVWRQATGSACSPDAALRHVLSHRALVSAAASQAFANPARQATAANAPMGARVLTLTLDDLGAIDRATFDRATVYRTTSHKPPQTPLTRPIAVCVGRPEALAEVMGDVMGEARAV